MSMLMMPEVRYRATRLVLNQKAVKQRDFEPKSTPTFL